MSSKNRETISVAVLALSIGIQVSAQLYAPLEASASANRVHIVARSQHSSSVLAKKDDDNEGDQDDTDKTKDDDKGQKQSTDENSKSSSHRILVSPDNPPDTASSDRTGSSAQQRSSSGNSGNSHDAKTAPSWNDTSETRGIEDHSSKTTEKNSNGKPEHVKGEAQDALPFSDRKAEKKETTEKQSTKQAASKVSPSEMSRSDAPVTKIKKYEKPPEGLPASFYIDTNYCRDVMEKVDAIVCKNLYSKKLAQTAWKDGLMKNREAILNSRSLRELSGSMGAAFAALKSSHCNFETTNDETYYFLHALFSDFNKKFKSLGKTDCVGFVSGGVSFEENQIRYILDESPAARAGLRIGDRLLKVNGHPYVGYINFIDTAGKNTALSIDRNGESKSITIKSEKEDMYTAYINAMRKSVHIDQEGGKKIGYVHVWSGGQRSFEALDQIMEDKLGDTDGLIFDLRDGYGGNSLNDLDRFYRSPKAYPIFETVNRNGKKNISRYYYDKPMVVIINGGSRSGKELLAFSFKRTGRATLVGTKTAGAVLAGGLFKVNDNASVYLAVLDGTLDGIRLEGVGVAPDVVIDNVTHDQAGYEKQFSVARETLLEQLMK